MKKFIFFLVFTLSLTTSCSPRNYFLVNSDSWIEYDRITGKVQVKWKWLLHKYRGDTTITKQDSIIVPVKVDADSISIVRSMN